MGLFGDTMTVLGTQLVFFIIGWIFFVKKLFKDYELRHIFVQVPLTLNFFTASFTPRQNS
jgi:golgi pH regulator